MAGLEPMKCEIMTWSEVRRLTDWATQAPQSIYLFLRDRETEREWGKNRESEAGSRLWAVSTEPIVTRAEVRHFTHWATQAPLVGHIFKANFSNLSRIFTFLENNFGSLPLITSGNPIMPSDNTLWFYFIVLSTGIIKYCFCNSSLRYFPPDRTGALPGQELWLSSSLNEGYWEQLKFQ